MGAAVVGPRWVVVRGSGGVAKLLLLLHTLRLLGFQSLAERVGVDVSAFVVGKIVVLLGNPSRGLQGQTGSTPTLPPLSDILQSILQQNDDENPGHATVAASRLPCTTTHERERRATASPPQHSPACLSQEARASTLGLPGPRGRHAVQ